MGERLNIFASMLLLTLNIAQFSLETTFFSSATVGALASNSESFSEGDNRPLLALLGRVPVKATTENGPIHPGDLLVASATHPGYAMRCADPNKCEGAIVGKALEALENREGLVVVLVTSH